MTEKTTPVSPKKDTTVLVADDSFIVRRVIRDIFAGTGNIKIVGEAVNGIEALDMTLKLNPDVIIMDMEMPKMDGMASLQHVLRFQPTPTIMLSGISKDGTARSFDAIKCGAVDFIYKDPFLQGKNLVTFEKEIVSKVRCASFVEVKAFEPTFVKKEYVPTTPAKPDDIIFCEECGTRNIFDAEYKRVSNELRCSQCGDLLEENLINKYKRINSITVIGGGRGAYSNLLKIVPKLPEEFNGTLLAMIYADKSHVDAFAEYLDAVSIIKTHRMSDGMNIEGGNCYLASADDNFYLKPYSNQFTIRSAKPTPGYGPIDILMNSASVLFKERVSGLVLSGMELDGEYGINIIRKNGGSAAILNAANCFCKEMRENIVKKCAVSKVINENEAAEFLINLHDI